MDFNLAKQPIKTILKQIPQTPGIYIYYNNQNEIIYIGKAKNLKKRVKSYWQKKQAESLWKKDLINKIAHIKLIEVKTEREALILESNHIKKYRPKYNVMLKDDKNYRFIRITEELFPRIYIAKADDIGTDSKNLFGPYVKSDIKITYETLQKIFRFRSCSLMPYKPCLLYYIDNCQAPCLAWRLIKKLKDKDPQRLNKTIIKNFGVSIEEYTKRYTTSINLTKLALKGRLKDLNIKIKDKMTKCAERKDFEQAAFWRDRLKDLDKFSSDNVSFFNNNPIYEIIGTKIITKYDEISNDERPSILKILTQDLELNKQPQRIEGYDISNLSHQYTVGSMVVWQNGEFANNEYRKFKIKNPKNERDDLLSHQEVMKRRLNHLESFSSEIKKAWPKPDLIMIDGGIAQLNAIKQVFITINKTYNFNINIPLCALAKKMETLYFFDKQNEMKGILIKNKPYYKILAGLRDEAHRFAITYNKLLRNKNLENSFKKL